MMRIINVVLLMVSRDYHRSAQPSMRTVNEGEPSQPVPKIRDALSASVRKVRFDGNRYRVASGL
jgi:hypothetical protein